METIPTVNIRLLEIWLAENGDSRARLQLCTEANLSLSTLNKILKGYVPRFNIRHRICKAMQVSESDLFPGAQVANAS